MTSETLDLTLARRGFRNGESAAADLERLPGISDELVEQIAGVADPDTALHSLVAIAESWGKPKLLKALEGDEELRQRLLVVLGTSEALGEFVSQHPDVIDDLAGDTLSRTPLPLAERREVMETASNADELRVAYRRMLLRLAARDLTALTSFEESSAELADLAVATLGAALRIARADEKDADTCRLAIIAMGKTGGRELNYLSDVDVVFVHEPVDGADEQKAVEAATRLAAATMRLCSEHTAEGVIWEVDANLRPEGRDGALVRTLASHVSYYERWAATWEFQALLKARFAAGDEQLAQAYLDAVVADGVGGQHARELRAGRPGDASPCRREHPVAAPGPRAQARRRRVARRGVRGAAAAARARSRRRVAAQPHHAAGVAGADRRRLRRSA